MFAVECLGDFVVEFLSVFIRAPPADEFLGQASVQVATLLFLGVAILSVAFGDDAVSSRNAPRIGIPVYRHLSFPFIFREVNHGCNCGAYFSGYATNQASWITVCPLSVRNRRDSTRGHFHLVPSTL